MPERPILECVVDSGAYFLPNRGVQMSQRWRASGLHRCAEWYGRGSYHSCSATTWIASPLVAALVTSWVKEGAINRILDSNRAEAKARQMLATETLSGLKSRCSPASYHLWVHLPEPWRQNQFEAQARKCGLIIPPSETFEIGRGPNRRSVRTGLGGISDRKLLAKGLERLWILIADGPQFEPVSV